MRGPAALCSGISLVAQATASADEPAAGSWWAYLGVAGPACPGACLEAAGNRGLGGGRQAAGAPAGMTAHGRRGMLLEGGVAGPRTAGVRGWGPGANGQWVETTFPLPQSWSWNGHGLVVARGVGEFAPIWDVAQAWVRLDRPGVRHRVVHKDSTLHQRRQRP